MYQLHPLKEVRNSSKWGLEYENKHDKISIMKLCVVWNHPSLILFQGQLWPSVAVSVQSQDLNEKDLIDLMLSNLVAGAVE